MEDHLHKKDNLDDFVQKSFEGYEEDPSPGMWNRIEGALETPVSKPKIPILRSRWFGPAKRWWSVAAAVLFVMLGWAGICTYYERKITALETIMSTPQLTPESWSPKMDTLVAQKVAKLMAEQQDRDDLGLPKSDVKTLQNEIFLPENTPKNRAKASRMAQPSKSTTPIEGGIAAYSLHARGQTIDAREKRIADGTTTIDRTSEEKNMTKSGSVLNASEQNNGLNPVNATGTEATMVMASEDSLLYAVERASNQVTMPSSAMVSVEVLPGRKATLLAAKLLVGNTPPMFPVIRPHRSGTGWYVGLQATPVFNKENAIAQPRKPIERPVSGPHPARRTPVFVNDRNGSSWSSNWGLAIGKKIGRHLSLETGIVFAHVRQESLHEAKFQFRDMRMGGMPNNHRFDFDYNLNTYGGSAAVSLRMEQVDRANPVPLTELLQIKITTKQQTQILKIPLLAVVHFGKGRLHYAVKAGPEGNFNISNHLETDVLTSLNAKFRLDPATVPEPVFETKRHFSWGYRASAGVEYRLLRHVSMVAEPVISGTFAQTDQLKQQLPGIISAGINLGVNYHF